MLIHFSSASNRRPILDLQMSTSHSSSAAAAAAATKPFSFPKTLKNPNSLSFPQSLTPIRSSLSSCPSPLKHRLSSGEVLYGLHLLSSSPSLADLAALSGYDYVIIDSADAMALSPAALPAVIRLSDPSTSAIAAALSLSPAALLFPSVSSPSLALAAVSSCRFPSLLPPAARPAVVLEVSSASAIDSIDRIAAIEGIDCVQLDPLGISASMGLLWDPGNRKVRAKVREAERRVLEAGCLLAGSAMPHDPAEGMKLRGYRMVVGAADIELFRKAAAGDVARFRKAAEKQEEVVGVEEDSEAEDDSYWKIM